MPQALAISLFVSSASAVLRHQEQKRARRANAEAERLQQKRSDIETQRERVKAIRQSRIANSKIAAASAGGEGDGGSGSIGARAGNTSQTASNLSFLDQQQSLSTSISNLNIASGRHKSKAGTLDAIGGVSGDIFDSQGGFEELFKTDSTSA